MKSQMYNFNLSTCSVEAMTGETGAYAILHSSETIVVSQKEARASTTNEKQQLFDLLAAVYHKMGEQGICLADRNAICEPFKILNKTEDMIKAEIKLKESARMLESVMREPVDCQYMLF